MVSFDEEQQADAEIKTWFNLRKLQIKDEQSG